MSKFTTSKLDNDNNRTYLIDEYTPQLNKTDNPLKLVKSSFNVMWRSDRGNSGELHKENGFVYGRFAAYKKSGNYMICDLHNGMSINSVYRFQDIKNKKVLLYVLESLQECYGDVNFFSEDFVDRDVIRQYHENFKMFLTQLIGEAIVNRWW